MKPRLFLLILLAGFAALPSSAWADAIYNVSLDTSNLIGNTAGPFSLDFQFNDGSGTNDGNNTVTLSNFAFGAGGPTGSAVTNGSVSGDLTSSVTLTDSDFFNEFTQTFTPGSTLVFTIDLTTNVDAGGVPDEFTFAILDSTDAEIPTLGPFDTVLLADIDSSSPALFGYASDPSRGTAATGDTLAFDAPVVTSPVPEPSVLWMSASGLAILALRRRSKMVAQSLRTDGAGSGENYRAAQSLGGRR
ncbi:MAG TPA: NF038129 family PEP-CTERM protein [Bryobacteraceae bacterium]|nr:NF038129 family PEP-CTERM protein [Bryobacteraceae bacterium]